MVKRVTFSNERRTLADISAHHIALETSIRVYFTALQVYFEAKYPERIFGNSMGGLLALLRERQEWFMEYSVEELSVEMQGRIDELNFTTSLSLLAMLESVFRIDYLQRVYKKRKDNLSRAFRSKYVEKGNRVSLESDILEEWKNNTTGVAPLISELKGAFKYRHWLAHGRYWSPKMAPEKYDYEYLYELAERAVASFPLVGVDT